MSTFGVTTDSASSSTSTTAKLITSQASPTATEYLVSLTARLWLSTASTCNIRGVIYSDNAGVPGTLLAVTNDSTFTNTAEAALTYNFTGANASVQVTSGGLYWIGVHFDIASPAATVNYSRGATASMTSSQSVAFSTSSPTTDGTAPTLSGPIDVFVTTTPTAPGGGAALTDGKFFPFF